eukprot:1149302-Pelagomonas_calceolata.AAC.3
MSELSKHTYASMCTKAGVLSSSVKREMPGFLLTMQRAAMIKCICFCTAIANLGNAAVHSYYL